MMSAPIMPLTSLILQIEPADLSSLKALIVFATGLLAAGFSLAIGYQAYRGYRRNRSRPMLYIASGIVLLTAVPFVGSLLLASVGGRAPFVTLLVQRFFEFAGLACITYALYGDHSQTPPQDEHPQESQPNANR